MLSVIYAMSFMPSVIMLSAVVPYKVIYVKIVHLANNWFDWHLKVNWLNLACMSCELIWKMCVNSDGWIWLIENVSERGGKEIAQVLMYEKHMKAYVWM
jgi:hypothetical protein